MFDDSSEHRQFVEEAKANASSGQDDGPTVVRRAAKSGPSFTLSKLLIRLQSRGGAGELERWGGHD